MKYRIVKKHSRDDSYREIRVRYAIEKLVPKGWITPEHWSAHMKTFDVDSSGSAMQKQVAFNTELAAREYIAYLLEPTPPDEVLG